MWKPPSSWAIGLLLTAKFWIPGLTPTLELGGIGLISMAIGLAFQDIYENFFAGMLLLRLFPFKNGDFIECESIMDAVKNITTRMTESQLTTGEMKFVLSIFVPHEEMSLVISNVYWMSVR